MKRLEINIDNCRDCDHRNRKWCVHPKIRGRSIPNNTTIPSWCPLPNAEENYEQTRKEKFFKENNIANPDNF